MKETITANDPRIMRLTTQADDITAMCEQLKDEYHPLLHGKRFITDAMLSELLGVSRRTTQDYRDRGLIPYYRLDGKILYAEEDIEIFLQSNYRPKFDCYDNGNQALRPVAVIIVFHCLMSVHNHAIKFLMHGSHILIYGLFLHFCIDLSCAYV